MSRKVIRLLSPDGQPPAQLTLAAPAQNRQEAEAICRDLNPDPAPSR
ncbi:hypothetical protein [Paenibacillus spiritus]|nr:hypothetical protein [Paenibacillus spiritus]